MRTRADKGYKFNLLRFLVYQKPIWRNMAFSITCIVACKSMVSILNWQHLIICEFTNNLDELVYIKTAFLCQFYIFVILAGSLNVIAHTCAS